MVGDVARPLQNMTASSWSSYHSEGCYRGLQIYLFPREVSHSDSGPLSIITWSWQSPRARKSRVYIFPWPSLPGRCFALPLLYSYVYMYCRRIHWRCLSYLELENRQLRPIAALFREYHVNRRAAEPIIDKRASGERDTKTSRGPRTIYGFPADGN